MTHDLDEAKDLQCLRKAVEAEDEDPAQGFRAKKERHNAIGGTVPKVVRAAPTLITPVHPLGIPHPARLGSFLFTCTSNNRILTGVYRPRFPAFIRLHGQTHIQTPFPHIRTPLPRAFRTCPPSVHRSAFQFALCAFPGIWERV